MIIQLQLIHLLLAPLKPLFATTRQLPHFTHLRCFLLHFMLIQAQPPLKLPYSIPQPQQLTTIRQLLPQAQLPPLQQAREQFHLQNTWYFSSQQYFPQKEAERNSASLPHSCLFQSTS